MQPIYVVLIINLIVWGGIFFYIFKLNLNLNRLKIRFDKMEKNGN